MHVWTIWQVEDGAYIRGHGHGMTIPKNAVFIGEFKAFTFPEAEKVFNAWREAGRPAVWPLESRKLAGDINVGHCGACLNKIDQTRYFWAWPPEGDRMAACSPACRITVQAGG